MQRRYYYVAVDQPGLQIDGRVGIGSRGDFSVEVPSSSPFGPIEAGNPHP